MTCGVGVGGGGVDKELVCAGAHPQASASRGGKSGKSFSFMLVFLLPFPPLPFSLVRGLRAAEIALADPRHETAQARAGFFDRMLRAVGEELVVLFLARLGFLDPASRKLAVLDFRQHFLHLGADRLVDDAGTSYDVAKLGRIGNGKT